MADFGFGFAYNGSPLPNDVSLCRRHVGGLGLIMKPAGVKVLPIARAPTMKRALTSDLHSILRKPAQSVGPRVRPRGVKFIDKERGLPLAEVFEVERLDVEVARKSACCSVF